MICLGPEFYLQMNLVVFFILSSSVNRAKSQTSTVCFFLIVKHILYNISFPSKYLLIIAPVNFFRNKMDE